MLCKPRHGLFVTGTSTEVGKTYITALLARLFTQQGCRVGVYKPVASGGFFTTDQLNPLPHLISTDAQQLWEAAGRPASVARVCPQVFRAPLAPHLAARSEGRAIDEGLLRDGLSWWHDQCDLVLVEGAGGLMSPIGDALYVADLAREFNYPLIIVAPNTLGVINQTLQTLITARSGTPPLTVQGVILNDLHAAADDLSRQSNFVELRRHATSPLLAHVPYQGTPADLGSLNWRAFCRD